MSQLERIEITGGDVEFYFDDSPEAFVPQEFVEGSVTRLHLERIRDKILWANIVFNKDVVIGGE